MRNPAKVITGSFLSLILAGAALLKMPAATDALYEISWIDALFMSASSVCVTGLTTLNVGQDLTPTGQIILISLAQIGGIGIMTFSLFFSLLLGRKVTFMGRLAAGAVTREKDAYSLFHSLGLVILMTVTFEAIAAIFLYLEMQKFHPSGYALFSAIFHSISGFCNAGLSLYPDSMEGFNQNYKIMGVMSAVIIVGGLGFTVIEEVRGWVIARLRKKDFVFSLHAKIVLWMTLILILLGAFVIWLLEKDNFMAGTSSAFQAMNALFLSAASRTAGFNSLDTSMLTEATLFWVMMLMFIGGAPGSTAGGIKLTSFAVLIALLWHQAKGTGSVTMFRRKIPNGVLGQSLAVFAAGFILINGAALLMDVTERSGIPHGQGRFIFDYLFEATSAFATTGLSTGVTPGLSLSGKWILIVLMVVGRLGPLTAGLAFLSRDRRPVGYEYAEEDVIIA